MAPTQAPPSPVRSAMASPSRLRRAPAATTAAALNKNINHTGIAALHLIGTYSAVLHPSGQRACFSDCGTSTSQCKMGIGCQEQAHCGRVGFGARNRQLLDTKAVTGSNPERAHLFR